MKLYDQHLHTYFSSDSNEKFENYFNLVIERGVTHFVSTEHMDLSCSFLGYDDTPNLGKFADILKQYAKIYDFTILKGIEIGYKFSRLKDIERIVESENFDVVIMSVHGCEDANCARSSFWNKKTADEAYSSYLDLYEHFLTHCSCFDIVGHVDFLLRYIDPVDMEKHEGQLTHVLNLVIKNEKCLEFNTRFLYFLNDDSYLKYIFTLYHKLGGYRVSLGSDAHSARYYMAGFDEAIALLKDIGFKHITAYVGRKEMHIAI